MQFNYDLCTENGGDLWYMYHVHFNWAKLHYDISRIQVESVRDENKTHDFQINSCTDVDKLSHIHLIHHHISNRLHLKCTWNPILMRKRNLLRMKHIVWSHYKDYRVRLMRCCRCKIRSCCSNIQWMVQQVQYSTHVKVSLSTFITSYLIVTLD